MNVMTKNGFNAMQANREWANRPQDERFVSLTDMLDAANDERDNSNNSVIASKLLTVEPTVDGALTVFGRGNVGSVEPSRISHHSFNQLSSLVGAPAGYLRKLPAALAADALNFGLKFSRASEDVGVLVTNNFNDDGGPVMLTSRSTRAITGPRYGRIWDNDIIRGLVNTFGDGITGDWRVPGEFGKRVEVTKANTTLFRGDRNMFVFLADEDHRIEIPNRRNGEPGSLARGFFVWNSEVGDTTFGISTFLFDYVCCNRIVWGATEAKTITIRHSAGAPARFLEQVKPALATYANASAKTIVDAVTTAQAKAIGSDQDEVNEWLANRFGKGMASQLQTIHALEEGRPIETLWDATTAVTAQARGIGYQDERVELERAGGALLDLATK